MAEGILLEINKWLSYIQGKLLYCWLWNKGDNLDPL